MIDLEVITPVDTADIEALLPIADAKAELRIESDDEDALFTDAILAAFDFFDGRNGILRRAVLPQKWAYYRYDFSAPFEIPLPPLRSVDEIAYRDDDGNWVVVDTSVYEVITGTLFGQINLAYNQSWPVATRRGRAVRVKFTAGYDGATPGTPPLPVPRGIVRGMKLLVGSFFNNREATFEDSRVTSVSRKIEYGIEATAGKYRIPNDLVDRPGDMEFCR